MSRVRIDHMSCMSRVHVNVCGVCDFRDIVPLGETLVLFIILRSLRYV